MKLSLLPSSDLWRKLDQAKSPRKHRHIVAELRNRHQHLVTNVSGTAHTSSSRHYSIPYPWEALHL